MTTLLLSSQRKHVFIVMHLYIEFCMAFPLQDLTNQLKKVSDEIADRESALQQQYQETLDHTKRKLQAHEVTIQRLTSTLSDKEQQLQVIH